MTTNTKTERKAVLAQRLVDIERAVQTLQIALWDASPEGVLGLDNYKGDVDLSLPREIAKVRSLVLAELRQLKGAR